MLGFTLGEPTSSQLLDGCPEPGGPEATAWSYGVPLLGRGKSSTVKGLVFAPSLLVGEAGEGLGLGVIRFCESFSIGFWTSRPPEADLNPLPRTNGLAQRAPLL